MSDRYLIIAEGFLRENGEWEYVHYPALSSDGYVPLEDNGHHLFIYAEHDFEEERDGELDSLNCFLGAVDQDGEK